jgi:perosamine synthetase
MNNISEPKKKISVAGPWITEKEIRYVSDAAQNAWYENANVYNEKFEASFAKYLDVKYAITLPSCTSAIHLSLLSMGIGPGDEVVVPDATWIASAAPISYVGATPVFADIDPNTWCLTGDTFERVITPKTRGVIAVDLYGGMPEMDAITEIAEKQNIAVIEDAAEAVGSEYRGKRAGNLGDVGVFSFHGSKTLTTGEGGMLVTDQEDIYNRCLVLRDHGRKPGDRMFRNTEVGYKYKMSSFQAALGLAQIERIEELVQRKREIFQWYKDELRDVDGVTLNAEPLNTKNTYWMVTVILDKRFHLDKEMMMEKLSEKNIDSRPFFHPLSSLPAYAHLDQAKEAAQRNTVSYRISPNGINLPSGFNLDRPTVKYVCHTLKIILNDHL